MFQSVQFDDFERDPYDGVPLGAEAIVPFLHEPAESEKNRGEERTATGQAFADPRWRG